MEEIRAIMEKFAQSGWDLIAVPAQEYLDGKSSDITKLLFAVKQADEQCGSCGCEFDPLYKKVLDYFSENSVCGQG